MARLRDSSAPLTLPACLRLVESFPHGAGVFAVAPLPLGLRLGPYEGCPLRADNADGGYSWRVHRGRLVDASDEAHSNWMRFVNCAPHAALQNVAGIQHRGALYFHTVAPVAVGDELLVYYGDDYTQNVDADGCYEYVPPKEEPQLDATDSDDGVGGDDGDAVDANGYCVPPKEEPEPELVATDSGDGVGGDGDDYIHPKEEPEPGLGGSDGDAVDADGYRVLPKEEPKPELCGCDRYVRDDYACKIDVDNYCKKHPEPEFVTMGGGSGSGGGAGKDYVCNVGADGYYDTFKEEPELGSCDRDDVDVDGFYNPHKEEPTSEVVATEDDAVAEDDLDVGYDCSHCGANLCTQEFKVEHETRCQVRMKRKGLESQITKLYHCCYCRCPFVNKEYREQHQQRYCPKKPAATRKDFNGPYFECDKCEYVAKWKWSLDRHLLNHNKNNAEWFACTQCSYKTVHKYAMTRHMKIHGNNFSYCCPICGKSFRTKRCLDDHLLRQHSDEWDEVSKLVTSKVYTCQICSQYRTTAKKNFNEHVTLTHHKGVGCQKHQCPRCPYSTFRKTDLKKHSKTHSEQKDYRCTVCKKQFIQKTQLDSHVLSYHSDNVDLMKTITSKIHRCRSCSFRTVQLAHLKEHARSKHV